MHLLRICTDSGILLVSSPSPRNPEPWIKNLTEAQRSFLNELKGRIYCKAFYLDYMTFNVTTNNLAESANGTFKTFRDEPIDLFMLRIVEWSVKSFIKHLTTALDMDNSHGLVPYAVAQVKITLVKAKEMQVTTGYDFSLVHDGTSNWRVSFSPSENGNTYIPHCACTYWDDTGLPCTHIVAASLASKVEVFSLVNKLYSIETYQRVWQMSVGLNPVD